MHINGSGYLSSSLGSLPRGSVALLPKCFFWLPIPVGLLHLANLVARSRNPSRKESEITYVSPSYHVVIIFYFLFQAFCLWQNMWEPALMTESSSSPASFLIYFYALTSGKSLFKVQVPSHLESLSYVSLPSENKIASTFQTLITFPAFLSSAWLDFASLGAHFYSTTHLINHGLSVDLTVRCHYAVSWGSLDCEGKFLSQGKYEMAVPWEHFNHVISSSAKAI